MTGIRGSLWRAAALYRVITLVVCCYLFVRWRHIYAHAGVAFAVGAAMALATAVLVLLVLTGRAHRGRVVVVDLLVTSALTVATIAAQTGGQRHGSMPTLTTLWAAGPAIEAGIVWGVVGGTVVGAVQLGVAVIVRAGWDGHTLGSGVLLVVVGAVVGYVARVGVRAEEQLRAASAERAAVAERDRLARTVHDGVLQVLGLVHRAGTSADGPLAELGAEAARQEAALRALITSAPPVPAGALDLTAQLRHIVAGRAVVSGPADAVQIPAFVSAELCAAVSAALDNVERHAGPDARAWVVVDRLPTQVHVTVRDDGIGIAPGRLDAAAREGRLGVASSIRGRLRDVGGTVAITSAPGRGTSVELVVPIDGTQP